MRSLVVISRSGLPRDPSAISAIPSQKQPSQTTSRCRGGDKLSRDKGSRDKESRDKGARDKGSRICHSIAHPGDANLSGPWQISVLIRIFPDKSALSIVPHFIMQAEKTVRQSTNPLRRSLRRQRVGPVLSGQNSEAIRLEEDHCTKALENMHWSDARPGHV